MEKKKKNLNYSFLNTGQLYRSLTWSEELKKKKNLVPVNYTSGRMVEKNTNPKLAGCEETSFN